MDLIKIEKIGGELLVDSRLIAEELGNEHKNTLEVIRKFEEKLSKYGGVAFKTLPIETNGGLQRMTVCFLNEKQATFLVTLSRNSEKAVDLKQKLIDSYFYYKEKDQPKIPSNFSEALQLAADQAKIIEEQKPKVEFHDQVLDSTGLLNMGETAKTLGLDYGRNTMFKVLREMKIFFKREPYQKYINSGYFEVKTTTNNEHVQKQAFTTPKGLIWLQKKFNKE